MGKLPLNDPCWCAMRVAIDLRERQTGASRLAILDLQQAMAGGKLRSMRRNLTSGEGELLSASFWKTYSIGYLSLSSVTICRSADIDRHKIDEYGNLVAERIDGWAWYVWKPDFETIWSPPAASVPVDQRDTRDQPSPSTQKREPGGAPAKFKREQKQWLQNKYSSDLAAEPRLAKHDAAVPHVKELAKTEFEIDVGPNTLLQQIIRPVLRAAKNNQ
jgi:hypothetical protein